eukprot:CAMPEP_0182523316 /NCGR_PEP_ID=MMETSP1323-20130603/962_1 /TAXON_ID=236787 /ORGANISM="Florenciella parvula, Strain RCC1693" /LENGTH=39 /DNA_ID= /DNA_START= /DNA_END= /DNA_ORIENTATION=
MARSFLITRTRPLAPRARLLLLCEQHGSSWAMASKGEPS